MQSAEKDFYDVIRSTSSSLKNTLTSNSAYYQGKVEGRAVVIYR